MSLWEYFKWDKRKQDREQKMGAGTGTENGSRGLRKLMIIE